MPRARKKPNLTQAYVRKIFAYHDDGYLVWRVPLNKSTKIGDRAGCSNVNDRGYYRIKINGWEYAVHRIIYLWHKGEHPPMVDHVNGNRGDNRISNLRSATGSNNSWNARLRKDAKVPVKGVTYRPEKPSPWIAELRVKGKRVLHASFKTLEEAAQAVKEARRRYHPGFYSDGDR